MRENLARNVHTLTLAGRSAPTLPSLLSNPRLFTSVECLELDTLNLDGFTRRGLETCLRNLAGVHTLSFRPMGHFRSFAYFLSQFPKLETLAVTSPKIFRGENNACPPEIQLRRTLALKLTSCNGDDVGSFFSCLKWAGIRCRSIGLEAVVVDNFASLEEFITICAGSLKSVQFINYEIRECRVSTSSVSC